MMFCPRTTLYLLMFLYFVSSECKGLGYPPSINCTSGECPKYNVVHSENFFEIRSYEEAVWMSSRKILENSYFGAFGTGYSRLDDYKRGENVEHVTIPMTTPIIVDVLDSIYTVYSYLPRKYQNNVPKALLDEIKPVKSPKHKYTAVRRVLGDLSDEHIAVEIDALKRSLQGTPYQRAAIPALFTIVAYDFPYESGDGINEIWLSFD